MDFEIKVVALGNRVAFQKTVVVKPLQEQSGYFDWALHYMENNSIN